MNKIRIMLVDDIKTAREWAGIVNNDKESRMSLEVIKEAKNGREAINYLECSEIRPDVVLMDIRFGDGIRPNGLETAKIITDRYPTIRVLILSAHDDIAYVRQAFQSGAQGYFFKSGEEGITELRQAIVTVWKGEYFVNPGIPERLIELVKVAGDGTNRLGLTPQELKCAQPYANRRTAKEIAAKLDIAIKTAEAHITAVRKKLRAASPEEVRMILLENRLLPPDEST